MSGENYSQIPMSKIFYTVTQHIQIQKQKLKMYVDQN